MIKLTMLHMIIWCCLVCTAKGQISDSQHLPDSGLNEDSLRLELAKQRQIFAEEMAQAQIDHMITYAAEKTFGYYILLDGQIVIEQNIIPAVQGLQGFISKTEAERVAKFVIDKIKQGEMPPMVRKEDLKYLNITLPR